MSDDLDQEDQYQDGPTAEEVYAWFKSLSPEDQTELLETMPKEERDDLLKIVEELDTRGDRKDVQEDFLAFVKQVWPEFIAGKHHAQMAEAFESVASGQCKRLIINMPPRHTKSEFASYLLPAWFLGKYPNKKIIQTSHTAELAVGFGRKVRNLVDSEKYKRLFPTVELQSDSKAAGRWNTNFGGDYFAIGVGGAVTGKGADVLIIDDPHSEQEAAIAAFNPEVYDKVYEWYTSGPRQRLQPGGAIVIVMTRWSLRDLTARVVKAEAQRGGEEWKVVNFPAILPDGEPLWPEFWSLKELTDLRNELPNSKWQAQYMQDPTSENSAIIKREWWREWEADSPPQCEFIIQAWDTAHEKKSVNDYSACTTWGVWYNEEDGNTPHLILLDAIKERMEFPELKKKAYEHYMYHEPDAFLVEKKAAGAPLIQELRRMGIPVGEYSPGKGQDKISRLNSVADLFASGKVWAPATRWADELIDEVASFPSGEHDDLVDAMTLALMRFRQGGFIRLESDEPDEVRYFKSSRRAAYY